MAHLEDARTASPRRPVAAGLDTSPSAEGVSRSHLHENGLTALLPLLLLCGWELASRAGLISALFFPAPSAIAASLLNSIWDGSLARNVGVTFSRMLLGLTIGGSLGMALGLAMGWSSRVRRLVDPYISALYPIPKIAIFPLVMLIFGIGETSKLIIISLGAFYPMLINTMAGTLQISPIHFEVAYNYGARPAQVFWRVLLPGSLPFILAALRLALNSTLLITIAVELTSANTGLGATIWLAWETLRTREMYATLIVISAIGILSNFTLQKLSHKLVPWQVEREAGS